MRLFVAIHVPQPLYRYCRQLQSQFPDMKNADEFHLTLQFLGDDIASAEPIIEALKTVQFVPFEIEMGDALPFPGSDRPRGVWIECAKNPALDKLAQGIRKALEPLGLIPDKPFTAHITLGRYKMPPARPVARVKGNPNTFAVSHFELMKSELTPRGPMHKSLARFGA